MLDNFVRNLIKGVYASQGSGNHYELVSEHGDLIRLILTHDRFTVKPKKNAYCRVKDISSEHGDLIPRVIELDTFNLPTVFGESDGFTNIDNNSDDFKYSDILDENGEVHADTLWFSPDLEDMLVQDVHGCLMYVLDCYTVSIITFPYSPLTIMSAPPPHHRGARPRDTPPAPRVRYACVACEFEDFQFAHSLRRHMVRIHNLACDTLVQGRPFPHLGYVMRRPKAKKNYNFPPTVFPDDWAVSHRVDVDPEAVSDRPPIFHRFVGVWANIRCVAICNADDYNASFRLNNSTECPRGRGRGQVCALLRLGQAARERSEAEALDHTLQEQLQNPEDGAK